MNISTREQPLKALRSKGFTVICSTDEAKFAEQLNVADEAWIISGSAYVCITNYQMILQRYVFAWHSPYHMQTNAAAKDQFHASVEKFNRSGKGLCIWADNEPYIVHANGVLQQLAHVKLSGVRLLLILQTFF